MLVDVRKEVGIFCGAIVLLYVCKVSNCVFGGMSCISNCLLFILVLGGDIDEVVSENFVIHFCLCAGVYIKRRTKFNN